MSTKNLSKMKLAKRSSNGQIDSTLTSSEDESYSSRQPPKKAKHQKRDASLNESKSKKKTIQSKFDNLISPPSVNITNNNGDDFEDDPYPEDGDGLEMNKEMQSLQTLLGKDFHKSLAAKQKKLDKYTNGVFDKYKSKIEEMSKDLHDSYKQTDQETTNQVKKIGEELDKSNKHLKEQISKMLKIMDQSVKYSENAINLQTQHITSLSKLHEDSAKKIQQANLLFESEIKSLLTTKLPKDMEGAHKMAIKDNMQQAIAKARKTLLEDP